MTAKLGDLIALPAAAIILTVIDATDRGQDADSYESTNCPRGKMGAAILRAINVHDALIEALEGVARWLQVLGDPNAAVAYNLARAALKLAREGTP